MSAVWRRALRLWDAVRDLWTPYVACEFCTAVMRAKDAGVCPVCGRREPLEVPDRS